MRNVCNTPPPPTPALPHTFMLSLYFRPDGVKFIASASSNEFLRRWDPKSGDIVTFKHRGFLLSTKCPKFPTIYRLRTDMTWDDVINNWDTKQRRTASAGTCSKAQQASLSVTLLNHVCARLACTKAKESGGTLSRLSHPKRIFQPSRQSKDLLLGCG